MTLSKQAQSWMAKLSCGQGRRDEVANVDVGQAIAKKKDKSGMAALVELLDDKKAGPHAIKAIYECGYLEPQLLLPYAEQFLDLLSNKTNRMVWGGMTAVMCVAKASPSLVWKRRHEVIEGLRTGSVITQNNALEALAAMANSSPSRKSSLSDVLVDAILRCRDKDLAKRIEDAWYALGKKARAVVREDAEDRIEDLTHSAQKRIRRVLRAD